MALAIFDLDHTLINGDSNQAWGALLGELKVDGCKDYLLKIEAFHRQYVDGILDINEFLSFALKPLRQNSIQQLIQWRELFMQQKIQPLMLEKAQACINAHKKRGDFTLIITASNSFITAPIAQAFRVDDVLATEAEMINGQFTGKHLGEACFKAGKITKLDEWLTNNKHKMEGSYFYSDSINDLPLLEKVTHPIVVDADDQLTAVAQQRNWQAISFL